MVLSHITTKLFVGCVLGSLDLHTTTYVWLIHQCCAVDSPRVSRRNHVSELFFDGAKYWIAHFDVEVRVLENVSLHMYIRMDIWRHHRGHQESKHERGSFVAIIVGEMFCSGDDGIDIRLIESKDAHKLW